MREHNLAKRFCCVVDDADNMPRENPILLGVTANVGDRWGSAAVRRARSLASRLIQSASDRAWPRGDAGDYAVSSRSEGAAGATYFFDTG